MMIIQSETIPKVGLRLQKWFAQNQRPLPWRQSQDPYRIWIAEIMLQQTTVKAVLPFYERFMERFPQVQNLAEASLEEVYPYWAGLGYYSRARNLKRAAELIYAQGDFPKSFAELLELPGLGPYTARAVSSQAFEERVGVVDGNVVRVLSRFFNQAIEHWTPRGRQTLQEQADQFVQKGRPSQINQALMELGATVCTTHKPACLLCPLSQDCQAFDAGTVGELPLAKPRRQQEFWLWEVDLYRHKDRIAFIRNEQTPFLRKQWVPPGKAKRCQVPPSDYHLVHTITHHKIFVRITRPKAKFKPSENQDWQWISRDQLKSVAPFSILEKVLDVGLADKS